MPAQQFKFLEVGPTLAVQSLDNEQSPSDTTRLIHEVHYTPSLHKITCDLGIEFFILFRTLWVISISIHFTLRWKNSSPTTTSDVSYASPSPIPVPPPALVMQEPLISEASSSSDDMEGEESLQTFSSELLRDVSIVINQPTTLLPIPNPPAPEVASTEIDPSNHTETEPNSQVTTTLVPIGNTTPPIS